MTERDDDLPLDDLRRAWSQLGAPRPDAELDACDEPTRASVAWMQQAWSRVQVPQPASNEEDLAHSDERTRAALTWIHRAWSNVEAPQPSIPASRSASLDERPLRAVAPSSTPEQHDAVAQRAASSVQSERSPSGTVAHPTLRNATSDAALRSSSSGNPRNRVRLRNALLSLAAAALATLGIWIALQRSTPGVRPQDVGNAVAENDVSTHPAPELSPELATDDVQLAALSPERVELCSGPVCLILLTGESSPRTR